jgi:hypothetical protein
VRFAIKRETHIYDTKKIIHNCLKPELCSKVLKHSISAHADFTDKLIFLNFITN